MISYSTNNIYLIAQIGLDSHCAHCLLAFIITSRVTEKGIRMNKQDEALRIEEWLAARDAAKTEVNDPYEDYKQYESWWNQFRAPWLRSDKMDVEQIKARVDEAWDCGDYKETISLMAELICRLEAANETR